MRSRGTALAYKPIPELQDLTFTLTTFRHLRRWNDKIERVYNNQGRGGFDPSLKPCYDTITKRCLMWIAYPAVAIIGIATAVVCTVVGCLICRRREGEMCFDTAVTSFANSVCMCSNMHAEIDASLTLQMVCIIRGHIRSTVAMAEEAIQMGNAAESSDSPYTTEERVALVKCRDELMNLGRLTPFTLRSDESLSMADNARIRQVDRAMARAVEFSKMEAIGQLHHNPTYVRECMICYGSLGNASSLSVLHGGTSHSSLCRCCADTLLTGSAIPKCPICRQDIERIVEDFTASTT